MSIPSSELIFECKKEGDYHEQFNSETYEAYIEKRIIPAFKNIYGHNKMLILMIDQATYHTRRAGFPSTTDSKQSIISFYDKHHIDKIKIKVYPLLHS